MENENKEPVRVNVIMEYEMHEKIVELAKKNHRTKSDQIRYMLDNYIKLLEQK